MIKTRILPLFIGLSLFACSNNQQEEMLVSSDIDNFWNAYEQIQAASDSATQMQILSEEFISKASTGQQRLFELRNYQPEEYLQNINSYPQFYADLRQNLESRETITAQIKKSLNNFRKLYPKMTNAKIYLGMGNFRTNATTLDSMVLFGSEMAFTDVDINTSEFPERLQYFKNYIQENPIENVSFLSTHEFVHTQQKEAIGTNLLCVALREGSAEFIAEIASGMSSTTPAVAYGKKNRDQVFEQFKKEMFNRGTSYWVWSNMENQFGHRDLGYYIGYEMSKFYYDGSDNKDQALADLIELDYSDIKAVQEFVNQLSFFEEPLPELEKEYRENQPVVEKVEQEGDKFTVYFSTPMDLRFRGFDYGPLGEDHVLRISEFLGFNEEGTALSFRATLTPEREQQMTITSNFKDKEGRELKQYLIKING